MDEFICPEGLGNQFPLLIQKNLAAIETAFDLEISLRGNKIMFSGKAPQTKKLLKYLQHLAKISSDNGSLHHHDILFSLNLVADGNCMTNVPGVFGAGDAVMGASLVVSAINLGRLAAAGADRYLVGR